MASNMERLEEIVARLPETTRVDIEAWGGEPTFRVGGKNFVFASPDATSISVKLPKEEAAAVVGTDPQVAPTGYGLGRHRLGLGHPRLSNQSGTLGGGGGVDPHVLHAGRAQATGEGDRPRGREPAVVAAQPSPSLLARRRGQEVESKSTSLVATVPAVRPGAAWYVQYRLVCAMT
jgi:hypothetical protein